jgi:transcriptional regulator with XRE-family HTH domain
LEYDARMTGQESASFGETLKAALRKAGMKQADLARALRVDAGQVSRWCSGKVPGIDRQPELERALGVDFSAAFASSLPKYELFVSAPIGGVAEEDKEDHQAAVQRIVDAAKEHVNGVYWPGLSGAHVGDFTAPDLVTEQNLRALSECHAYLYVQFAEMVHPSSSLIELGFALGKKLKTTIIVKDGVTLPYMLDGFGGVAASLPFLPKARVYQLADVEHAVARVARNGRELFGLR